MPKKEISLIKLENRTGDGNLRSEAKETALQFIEKHLRRTGHLNVSEIASLLGLSRSTARGLVDIVLDKWQDEVEDQTLVQAKWHEEALRLASESPELLTKDMVANLKLRSALMGRVSALQKILLKAPPRTRIVKHRPVRSRVQEGSPPAPDKSANSGQKELKSPVKS